MLTATQAGRPGWRVVAVDVLAGESHEKTTPPGLAAVAHGRCCRRHGTVTQERSADDGGDLAQGERNHPPGPAAAAVDARRPPADRAVGGAARAEEAGVEELGVDAGGG
ncbi:hypothetical protein FAGKG844_60092 [Frankia sp. AgKG'84/4]